MKDLDAVIVASPLHIHARHFLDTLAAGKDLYAEKTMTWSIPEADQCLVAANSSGRIIQIGLQWQSSGSLSKAEIPTLVELQNEYGPEGFQVIGVSLDDYASTEEISDYAREMNVNYPIVIGNTSSFEKRYGGVFFLPMTFFLDRDGKVVAREIGVQGRKVYVEHIRRSLDQEPAAQSRR
jgi:thiol-disulfide isomerase/thioredoxin